MSQKIVAVAGGSGSIGRSVAEAIIADGKFKVIILGRKENAELSKAIGAPIIATDYSTVDSVVRVLEDNNVHTLISGLGLGGGVPASNEIALLHAADRSTVTERFITSNWGVKYTQEHGKFLLSSAKVEVAAELQKVKNVEWTSVCNGLFLDYWGFPKIKSYLTPMTLVVDIAAKKAAIPGSGDVPVVFTYSEDIGKFTAALLTLEKWDKESYIVGDKLTWNEFLKVSEDVVGEKFDVVYDSPELLEAGGVSELPSHVPAYAFVPKEVLQGILSSIELFFYQGDFDFGSKKTLNEVFPHLKTKSVKDVIEIGWKH
ncbi:unnamed protein product [Clonostachys rosea]|uniref:NmrA-like domain-containing protein n=1 Tax=Bionectria ochroleuca TaxID=29856 RepID=A0ABY6UMA0_BIOOC|nr:unnamed protein product [Clonostachys rosea]